MTRLLRRMLAALACATVTAVTLAGCATIPRDGAVKGGVEIDSAGEGFDSFDYIAAGPVDGATQEQLIRGFIRAALSPQGNFQVARSFLTPEFADEWKADESITVYGIGGRTATQTGDDTWKVVIEPTAFVDAEGGYRVADRMNSITQSYSFEKVEGQWRIASAPDGTIVDSSSFENVYSAHTLYFYDSTGDFLVPDQRWFPSGATTPTRVVKALLAGPSSWLKGAVSTAFPQGTKLGSESVQVVSGTAEVELSDAAAAASDEQLSRMRLQVRRSLSDIPAVQSVVLSSSGIDRQSASLGDPPLRDPSVDQRPLVLTDDLFGFSAKDDVSTIPYVSSSILELDPSAVTLSADWVQAAALSDGGVYRISGGAAQLLDTRPHLVAPTIDPEGFVWSTASGRSSEIYAFGSDGTPLEVGLESTDVHSITALAMSRDGTRLAMLLHGDGEDSLVVSGVLRSQNGVPERLSEPLTVARFPQAPASLTWVDELTVAVLEPQPDGSAITTQSIGGQRHSTTAPEGTRAVVGAGGMTDYWVLTDDGVVQSPQGSGWQERVDGVRLLATQSGAPH